MGSSAVGSSEWRVVFLGVDCGTQSVKCVAVEPESMNVLASTREAIAASHGEEVGTDPDVWWQSVCRCLRRVAAECLMAGRRPLGIGLCGTNSSLVPCDADMSPVGPVSMWLDATAVQQAAILNRNLVASGIRRRVNPDSGAARIMAIASAAMADAPDGASRAARLVEATSWFAYRLTGKLALSGTIEATSWGIPLDCWQYALPAEGLRRRIGELTAMPVVGPTQVMGRVRPDLAAGLGLDSAAAVVLTGNDGLIAALGAGLLAQRPYAVEVAGTGQSVWRAGPAPAASGPGVDVYRGLLAGSDAVIAVTGAGLGGLELRRLLARAHLNAFAAPPSLSMSLSPGSASLDKADRVLVARARWILERSLEHDRPPGTAATGPESEDLESDYIAALAVQAVRAEAGFTRLRDLFGRPADTVVTGGFSANPLYLAIRQSLAGPGRRVLRATVPDQAAYTTACLALYSHGGIAVPSPAVPRTLDQSALEPAPEVELKAAGRLRQMLS